MKYLGEEGRLAKRAVKRCVWLLDTPDKNGNPRKCLKKTEIHSDLCAAHIHERNMKAEVEKRTKQEIAKRKVSVNQNPDSDKVYQSVMALRETVEAAGPEIAARFEAQLVTAEHLAIRFDNATLTPAEVGHYRTLLKDIHQRLDTIFGGQQSFDLLQGVQLTINENARKRAEKGW